MVLFYSLSYVSHSERISDPGFVLEKVQCYLQHFPEYNKTAHIDNQYLRDRMLFQQVVNQLMNSMKTLD